MAGLRTFGRRFGICSGPRLIAPLVVCSTLALGSAASAATVTFANTALFGLPDDQQVASTVIVSGMPGVVQTVTLSLFDLNHFLLSDVDMLLVSPTGASLIVMSDVGSRATNVNLTLSDAGSFFLSSGIVTGTFKPTDLSDGGTEGFLAPAPATPLSAGPTGSSTFASAFGGANPNGTWTLYARDDSHAVYGYIAGGWALTVTTIDVQPPPPPPTTAPEPASMALLGAGLLGVVGRQWRRRR